ncbi:MAG TPA: cytochrome c [Terriglobales bacterium]|nr:cytochrome c [Terriglobales bacterium]
MRTVLLICYSAFILSFLAGCDVQRRKSDAELGLNPQQAAGRRVFDYSCARCHEAYSSSDLQGPSLQHMFKKQYLRSGLPANDDRVAEVVRYGKSKMPSFGNVLTPQQIQDLMAYLHTL